MAHDIPYLERDDVYENTVAVWGPVNWSKLTIYNLSSPNRCMPLRIGFGDLVYTLKELVFDRCEPAVVTYRSPRGYELHIPRSRADVPTEVRGSDELPRG